MGRMAPGGSFARGGEAGYVSGVGSVVGGLMVVGGGLRVEGGPVVRVVRVVGGSILVEVEPLTFGVDPVVSPLGSVVEVVELVVVVGSTACVLRKLSFQATGS